MAGFVLPQTARQPKAMMRHAMKRKNRTKKVERET
jgi:hypothetical protein